MNSTGQLQYIMQGAAPSLTLPESLTTGYSNHLYGRRELIALFYRIATTQLVVHAKTCEPRNPEAKAYYDRLMAPKPPCEALARRAEAVTEATEVAEAA